VLGRALVVRGVVDLGPDRLRFVEEAVAVLEGTSAQLELASATVELGVALRRAGRRRASRERLVSGADLAYRCGAEALAARARLELVSLGARPRRAAFSGVSSLTACELRVARLAAAGLTNRAIAQELIVSVKTVSGQLTSVYRKLEVHDRAALIAAMQQANDREPDIEAVH
jgi:DNA-binding NarL/FixJ family response regulator